MEAFLRCVRDWLVLFTLQADSDHYHGGLTERQQYRLEAHTSN